ncbi:MAG: PAS domain S-box protein, partial [Chloroflexota bacterium]
MWDLITAPSAGVQGSEKRRQAQLLATLLLILIILSPISLVIIQRYASTQPGGLMGNSSSVLVLAAIAVLLICYALSRTRLYLIAAIAAMLVAPLAIFSAIIVSPADNFDLSRYLVLDLLICGIMFSVRITALIALGYLAASLFVFYGLLHIPSPDPMYTLVYLVIGAALILTFMRYRDQTEADRQRVLAVARDELRANRELYRTLAQNLPKSAVLLYDHNLRFLVVEGTALTHIGYSKALVEGKNLQDVFDPGTTPAIETDYHSALNGQEIIRERVINGQIYRAHHLPVRNESGLITAGMLLLQNITEQKSAEAALRESEERYRLMAENSTDLISVQTPDGVYLYASPAAHLLLGYEPDALIGKSSFDFLDPDDVTRVRRVNERILESPGVTTIAYRIRRMDGSYTWMENASRLVSNPSGEKQIVTASRDISERMEANEALRRSEEQFRSLVASMDNLVFSINLEGHFLVYHPMPLSIYDTPFDTEVFVGKHYRDVLPDVLSARLGEAVAVTMSVLSTQQIDYSLDVEGQERFYSARISPMIATNLQLLGATVVVTDVTEAVVARQRQQRLLDLEILQREIGMLFLGTDDSNLVIDQALEIMGTFLDVSRAYMYRLRENERLLDNAHEWCAPGVSPEIQNLQGLAYDELFPSLLPMLVKEGIAAPEHISEFAPDLYRALDAQAIQSVLFLPFYVDERLDGFLGFDEMRHPRKWLPEEIAAIRAFGQSCVSVFERERSQLALIQARDSALHSAKLKSEFVS